MSYFEDGSRYRYRPEFEDGSVNIGWLDASQAYPAGPVPGAFVERLTELCLHGVNRMRGFHYCNLCPPTPGPDLPEPAHIWTPEGEYAIGSAEIRVDGADGVRYAAPDLVIHYVTEHGYRPPDGFIEAVLKSGGDA
jgi:hypothetical protein